MTTITDHDAYIAAAPETFQPSLKRLRAILARTLPEAEEIVAYNMPGVSIDGSVVASYAAFSKQCGLYPFYAPSPNMPKKSRPPA